MRRRSIGLTLAATFLAGGAIVGCVLFTGSSDGYKEADGGPDSAPPVVDGACQADTGLFCFNNGCVQTQDCIESSDASNAVCCLGILSSNVVGSICEIGSCGLGTVQSCQTSAECGEGVGCVHQQCNFTAEGVSFHACGLVPGCALIAPGTPNDSGTPDTGSGDSGNLDAGNGDADASESGITDASDSG